MRVTPCASLRTDRQELKARSRFCFISTVVAMWLARQRESVPNTASSRSTSAA